MISILSNMIKYFLRIAYIICFHKVILASVAVAQPSPVKINAGSTNVNNVHTPKNVKVTKKIVLSTPKNVKITKKVVGSTPKNIKVSKKIVRNTSKKIKATKKVVRNTQKNVKATKKVVSSTPKNIKATKKVAHTIQKNKKTIHYSSNIKFKNTKQSRNVRNKITKIFKKTPGKKLTLAKVFQPQPIESALVVNSQTGNILYAHNADIRVHPASLTKMMTVYMVFDAIKKKRINFNSRIVFSQYASSAPASKLYVAPGESMTYRDAVNALIVKSANDVARAVGENLYGSELKCASQMTYVAKKLGMNHTTFYNTSGLYHSEQKTTAIDMAKLAIALRRDFPQYYHMFSLTSFKFKDKVYNTHNKVTYTYNGAEGMKTGYINAAGYNLVTAASRHGQRLVGVVVGQKSSAIRDEKMMNLLDKYFLKLQLLYPTNIAQNSNNQNAKSDQLLHRDFNSKVSSIISAHL